MNGYTTTINGEERPVCAICKHVRGWGGVRVCQKCKKFLCTTGCKCACKTGVAKRWDQ